MGRARTIRNRGLGSTVELNHGGSVQRIEPHSATGRADDVSKYATELFALARDVILATASLRVRALQAANLVVSIVFAYTADPVGDGFVDARGTNSTDRSERLDQFGEPLRYRAKAVLSNEDVM